MVDTNRLKAALHKKGITVSQASEAIGVNSATFFRRLNRQGATFTVEEIEKLADLLEFDGKTIQSIFFAR